MPPTAPFVAQIDPTLVDKLLQGLREQDFELSTPPHTRFQGKKKGITCTLYTSGKLVVQGKEMNAFIEFYLEPEILGAFTFTHPATVEEIPAIPHIGIDESGKGDFFGPLCIAGVYADGKGIAELQRIGVKDSKALTDARINQIAPKIKAACLFHLVRINPTKYNQLYPQFNNLNRMLAWGHATAIEQLVEQSGCPVVTIDQFANESVVITALKRKKLNIHLTQRHRAEEDVVVAAASILARHAFLEGLEKLSQEMGFTLPKGASAATIAAGRKVLTKWGEEGLVRVSKTHFKTYNIIHQ